MARSLWMSTGQEWEGRTTWTPKLNLNVHTYRSIYPCVYFHKWDNALSVVSVVFLLFRLYKWLLKQLWKTIGDEGRSKGVYNPIEVNKHCGHILCGQFELAHRQHQINLSHRWGYSVLYPLALMFQKHPAGPQMVVRMVVKVQDKTKKYKGIHRQVEQDLQRSELLPFFLMAWY